MPGPTTIARIRQTLGRAFRETGQALDRVAIRASTQLNSTRELGDDPTIFDDHLSRHRNLMPLIKRGSPKIHNDVAFIAPCSSLIGSVYVGEGSSIWYKSVLRADKCNMGCGRSEEEYEEWKEMEKEDREVLDRGYDDSGGAGGIFIGNGTNIQDGCIVTSRDDHTRIGNNVTVGHSAQIHSATVGDNCLIGMGSVLNPGSKVESMSFVAAGAVVPRDHVVKSGELWVGNPARKVRDLTQKERNQLAFQATEYVKKATEQSGTMLLGGNISDIGNTPSDDCEESSKKQI
jgi:carbonic anhydrase/acetyltransferase-like protein (isoleucine patch superfamily)